ncbi:hypothetical protein [Myroides sp. N17-2]|uniref:hypothetical protein n=1 Tax=Myroides sp. N17-2 TaxID=2030799 RepID=UPI000EFB5675|nr:hypothetical protein [Myroides sp. N17-2]
MNIVYFVFGSNINYYQQVIFSICTALVNKEESDRIIVIAEEPTLFKLVADFVTIIPIDNDIISEWKGDYNFIFRTKIKALQLIAERYPDQHILYLDGDTFFYKSLTVLKQELYKGNGIMHVKEDALYQKKTKTEKKLWSKVKDKTFANILVDKSINMWNAGVIGIPNTNFDLINVALQINDEMCDNNALCFLVEQLSFSIVLEKQLKLNACDHVIGHYWGNKEEWDVIISDWMKKSLMSNYTLQEMIEEVKNVPFHEIPVYVKRSNTGIRLTKKIQTMFKPRSKSYIK